MSSVKRIKKQLSPLCFLPDGRLVCYQYGHLIILKEDSFDSSYPLFSNKRECWLGHYSLLYRLLRLGIRTAIAIDDTHLLLSIGNRVCEYDLASGVLSAGYDLGTVRPLVFTAIHNQPGFDNTIVFGSYLLNREKNPMHIYVRKGVDQWEKAYTFPKGVINHIHQIIPDPYRKCVWVFTGDFDESAAIWKITENFRHIERIACNDQKYRACVAYALPEGLLYATDAPYAENYIYLLNPDTLEIRSLFPLDGSCIYGCQWGDQYVFSSTVEGDGRHLSPWQFLFSRAIGAGIKDYYAHLYVGNINSGFREIYREEKDIMPLYTFQFGVFKFPHGANLSQSLFFQPVATKQNDLCLMSFQA